MKTIPIPNNKKTVVLGDIDIFLSDNVGTLLTNKIAIVTVKKGVIFLTSNIYKAVWNHQDKNIFFYCLLGNICQNE